jgi:hypothetical protein
MDWGNVADWVQVGAAVEALGIVWWSSLALPFPSLIFQQQAARSARPFFKFKSSKDPG